MDNKILLTGFFLLLSSIVFGQGGIDTNFGFNVQSNVPADLRETVATDADTANVDFKYIGMRVRSDATNNIFEWTGDKWVSGGKVYSVATQAELAELPCPPNNWAYVVDEDAWYYCDGTQWVQFLGGGESTTATNGLTLSGTDVKLGGALTENSEIDQNGNNINLNGVGSLSKQLGNSGEKIFEIISLVNSSNSGIFYGDPSDRFSFYGFGTSTQSGIQFSSNNGYAIGSLNSGNYVTALGGIQNAWMNSGNNFVGGGYKAGSGNTGGNVVVLGRENAYRNTKNNVTAIGHNVYSDQSSADTITILQADINTTTKRMYAPDIIDSLGGLSVGEFVVLEFVGGSASGLGISGQNKYEYVGNDSLELIFNNFGTVTTDLSFSYKALQHEDITLVGNNIEPSKDHQSTFGSPTTTEARLYGYINLPSSFQSSGVDVENGSIFKVFNGDLYYKEMDGTVTNLLADINTQNTVNTLTNRIPYWDGNSWETTHFRNNSFVFESNNFVLSSIAIPNRTSGTFNTGLGIAVLNDLTTGVGNAGFGGNSLTKLLDGASNVGIGNNTGGALITGDDNVFIGTSAGQYNNNLTFLDSAFQCIYIGVNSTSSQDGVTNEIVIGYDGEGSGDNTVTIGNADVTDNYFNGTVHADNFTGIQESDLPTRPATDVTVTDAGGYFTGADMEAVTQELGADLYDQANLRSLIGIQRGAVSSTTDASGQISVGHGLSSTPTSVVVTSTTNDSWTVSVVAKNSTQFTVKFFDETGAAVASTSAGFDWIAIE